MAAFLSRGAAPRKALDKIRAQIEAIDDELNGASDAPITAEEAEARIRSMLSHPIHGEGGRVQSFINSATQRDGYGLSEAFSAPLTLSGLAALLGEETVVDALMQRVRPKCEGGIAIAAERARRDELQTRRRELQAADERAVLALEAAGYQCDRPFFDPGIALPIWDEAA